MKTKTDFSRPLIAAATVATIGPNVIFVRQPGGPYAGQLLLPGGKIDFQETASAAACREFFEETGFAGYEPIFVRTYEIIGDSPDHHFFLVAFRFNAIGGAKAERECEPIIAHPDSVVPHATARKILNDAGVGFYSESEIRFDLHKDGIFMSSLSDEEMWR